MSSFFQWVSLYSSLSANIMDKDRDEMMDVWDNDDEFDVWLKKLDATRKANSKRKPGANGKVAISNEEYLRKYAKVHGGEGAAP
jgi:predicted RNA-binding Zn ribbon-like protein